MNLRKLLQQITSPIFLQCILSISIVLVLFFHYWQLGSLPKGLYVDESSIGLNAAFIARDGVDEHGVAWPTYFEAFGEYKNPVYIYAAAGVFAVAGVSEFTLRFTSFLFFSVFLIGWVVLLQVLFKQNYFLHVYGVLSAGFLPWFFNLSRIAFEVISQLSFMVWVLVLTKLSYSEEHRKNHTDQQRFFYNWVLPIATGLILGGSVYTYSTARLISGLFFITLLAVYRPIRYWIIHLKVGIGCAIALIPYFLYSLENPEAMTSRFKVVSYLYDTSLSLIEKLWLFINNYFQFLSPQYLLFQGDSSMRHDPGPGGAVFTSIVILVIAGFWYLVRSSKRQFWNQVILLNFIISPVAAALTTGDSSLRTIIVGLLLVLISCYGFLQVQEFKKNKAKKIVLGSLMLLLVIEIITFLYSYFLVFPQKSIWAFESYNVEKSIKTALQVSPTNTVASEKGNQQYAHIQFYLLSLGLSEHTIPIVPPIAMPDRCVIVSAFDFEVENEEIYQVTEYGDPHDFTKVKCFR